MAGDPFEIEPIEEHVYLARVQDAGDEVAVTLHLDEATNDDLGVGPVSEDQVAAAILRYLLSRQKAFDLPEQIDVYDIPAAYPEFIETVRREVLTR